MTAMRAEISEQTAALRATLDALLPRSGEAGRLAAGARQVVLIPRGAKGKPAVVRRFLPPADAGLLAPPGPPSVAPRLPRPRRPPARVAGVVVSGRGLDYSAALELALKLKEACYLHAMGLSYADLLHGPMAVVDAQTPAIIVAADSGPVLAGTIDLARRVTAAGARAYAIGGAPRLSPPPAPPAPRPPPPPPPCPL